MLEDGATLTAGTGGWTGTEPITFTYQWQRCDADGANCEDIAGATDPTYTLTADDVGGTVRVIVTATNDAGDGHEHLAGHRRPSPRARPSARRRPP